MKEFVQIAFLVFFFGSVAGASEDCGWLARAEVDRAFPEHAPWRTMVGGKVGMCKFRSRPGKPPSIFGANQMVKASAAEAEEQIRSLKTSIEKSYDVEPAPELGLQGFRYKPKSVEGEGSGRMLFFAGHRKKVVVIGSLSLQSSITPAQRDAAETLIRAALAIADDDEALSAASNCPYFDPALIERLLPGKDFNQNVFGANSCMAQASGKVVVLSVVEDMSAEQAAARVKIDKKNCDSEPLPMLGKAASIVYSCSEGRPRAVVRFLSGNKMLKFSLSSETEPTAADRALLIEVAERSISP